MLASMVSIVLAIVFTLSGSGKARESRQKEKNSDIIPTIGDNA